MITEALLSKRKGNKSKVCSDNLSHHFFPDATWFKCPNTLMHQYIFCLYVCRFSTDEGQCWNIFNFTDHPIFLAGLASEPGTKTMNISIFGYRPDDDDQPMWVAVTVDFDHLLTRECKLVYNNYSIFHLLWVVATASKLRCFDVLNSCLAIATVDCGLILWVISVYILYLLSFGACIINLVLSIM